MKRIVSLLLVIVVAFSIFVISSTAKHDNEKTVKPVKPEIPTPNPPNNKPTSMHIFGFVPLGLALDNTALTWYTNPDPGPWFGQDVIYIYGGAAAQSGSIGDYGISWLSTNVTGSGTLSFYWKVSSEVNYDFLEFYIDDVRQARISGEVQWTPMNYSIGPGQHMLKWRYTKDVSLSRGSDAGWVDKVVWTEQPQISLNEATDTTAFPLYSFGNAYWFGETTTYYYGGDAAQSGYIGDNQETTMYANLTSPVAQILTFVWKVSSESSYDFLEFYIDGVRQARISGEVQWTPMNYSLGPGPHMIKWRYVKDYSLKSGSDAGWVDHIVLMDS